MSENKIDIGGISLSNLNWHQVLEEIEKYLLEDQRLKTNDHLKSFQPLVIFTPNPEIIIYAQKDKQFKKIVNSAQITVADGQGVIWASRLLGKKLPERITGTDLAKKLIELAAEKGLPIGLIGGSPLLALQAIDCLKREYPQLKAWGEEGPRMERVGDKWEMESGYNLDLLIEKIDKMETQIILVGMGAPKQEIFINQLIHQTSFFIHQPLVFLSVGGAFDYFAGKLPRAPKWGQKIGLEWLFRLIFQPWRIKRQLALLKFIFLVCKAKLS